MLVLAVPMSENLVAECTSCGHRMAVPEDQRQEFRERLIGAEEIAQLSAGASEQRQVETPQPRERTAYQVLQVDQDADPEVIQAAFKRLAFKHHPDRRTSDSSEDRMRELSMAYEILSDPSRRLQYDLTVGIPRAAPKVPAMRPDEV